MTTLIDTESGARYEFDGGRVRRVNPDHNKRGDGEWQVLVSRFPETPVVGSPMVLVMESLSRYGEDDYGTSPEFVGDTTTRTTTPVVRIWWEIVGPGESATETRRIDEREESQ